MTYCRLVAIVVLFNFFLVLEVFAGRQVLNIHVFALNVASGNETMAVTLFAGRPKITDLIHQWPEAALRIPHRDKHVLIL